MNYCDTYQTIQQLLYNGKADCIMLMQCSKSVVFVVIPGGGGAHPLHPPPRSVPAWGGTELPI